MRMHMIMKQCEYAVPDESSAQDIQRNELTSAIVTIDHHTAVA